MLTGMIHLKIWMVIIYSIYAIRKFVQKVNWHLSLKILLLILYRFTILKKYIMHIIIKKYMYK